MVTVASESSATQLTNGNIFTPSTTKQTEKTRDKLRQSMSQQLLTNFTWPLRPRSSFLTPSCCFFLFLISSVLFSTTAQMSHSLLSGCGSVLCPVSGSSPDSCIAVVHWRHYCLSPERFPSCVPIRGLSTWTLHVLPASVTNVQWLILHFLYCGWLSTSTHMTAAIY